MDPRTKANKYKAKKFKLTKVTGRTIAYACVQAYIALSSMSQWGSSDNIFNLQEFYRTIVAMFETDPHHPWVVETLEWWNEKVPGLRPTTSKQKKQKVSNALERTRPNPLERILAQRARRAEHQRPDQDHLVERRPLPLQPAQPAPSPRPVQPTQQGPTPRRVQTQALQTRPRPVQLYQQSQYKNDDGGDSEEDEQGERPDENDGNGAGNAWNSENEVQVEAEDQARRLEAEKEEVARQSKNGKPKSHSTLFRRPSLTVTTNVPATSSCDTRSSSTRKRVHHQDPGMESELTDLENEQPKKKKRQASSGGSKKKTTVSKGKQK